MTQKDDIIDSLENLGGMATLKELYSKTPAIREWGTKTPYATIRRLVQNRDGKDDFVRLRVGLYCLKKYQDRFSHLSESIPEKSVDDFHSYYQGLLLDIGQTRKLSTYAPNNNRKKDVKGMNGVVGDFCTLTDMPSFSYDKFTHLAKHIDVIWFNHQHMPTHFFEVEFSTDMKNSLIKFVELQWFYTRFVIVADKTKERQFNDVKSMEAFRPIRDRVEFWDFDNLDTLYYPNELKTLAEI